MFKLISIVPAFFKRYRGWLVMSVICGSLAGCAIGTLQMFDGIPQIVHPDRVVDEAGFAKLSGIDPVCAIAGCERPPKTASSSSRGLPNWPPPTHEEKSRSH